MGRGEGGGGAIGVLGGTAFGGGIGGGLEVCGEVGGEGNRSSTAWLSPASTGDTSCSKNFTSEVITDFLRVGTCTL